MQEIKRINLGRLNQKNKLNDEEIDLLIKTFGRIEPINANEQADAKNNIAFIGSLTMDAALFKDRNNQIKTKENAKSCLGDLLKNRIAHGDGIMIVVHGPYAGNQIYNNAQTNSLTEKNHHWSLAYFSKELDTFYHYDSLNNYNQDKFLEIARYLIKWEILLTKNTKIIAPKMVQKQTGTWECGYFTILFATIITSKRKTTPISKQDILECDQNNFFDMNPGSFFRNRLLEYSANL